MKRVALNLAVRYMIRLFTVVTAGALAIVCGVLIATPGISRFAGIEGLIWTGLILGVLFSDWIRYGHKLPQRAERREGGEPR